MPAPKTLQIRDAKVRALATKLAERRRITMTEAVRQALEAELEREIPAEPLAVQVARIAQKLKALPGGPGPGRIMTKDEIDEMWGH